MPLISIIIPLSSGETAWRQLLPQILKLDADIEILMLCADDNDVSAIQASTAYHQNLRVFSGNAGRAGLMNQGASLSNGCYLWFLHADSFLPNDCAAVLLQATRLNNPALYYFDLQFLADGPRWMPLNNAGVYFRSHYLKMPFGDQGFFLSKTVFDLIGGFNIMAPFGEDHLLVWQAHHRGIPVLPIGSILMTSARKYDRHGWIKTTLKHLFLTISQALPQCWLLIKHRLYKP